MMLAGRQRTLPILHYNARQRDREGEKHWQLQPAGCLGRTPHSNGRHVLWAGPALNAACQQRHGGKHKKQEGHGVRASDGPTVDPLGFTGGMGGLQQEGQVATGAPAPQPPRQTLVRGSMQVRQCCVGGDSSCFSRAAQLPRGGMVPGKRQGSSRKNQNGVTTPEGTGGRSMLCASWRGAG